MVFSKKSMYDGCDAAKKRFYSKIQASPILWKTIAR
jgi:hypothetical protein